MMGTKDGEEAGDDQAEGHEGPGPGGLRAHCKVSKDRASVESRGSSEPHLGRELGC